MCGREELDPADRAELTFIVLANQYDTSTGPVPPVGTMVPVSYTHLTLPTICSV